MPKRIRMTMLWLIGIYLLISAVPYLFEKQLIFQGKSLPLAFDYNFDGDFKEHFISMSDGVALNAILFKTPVPRKGLILYTHGNADNLKRWGTYRNDFLSRGYDILMYDYRGYGKSEGSPGDKILRQDGIEIYDWLQQSFPQDSIILYGRSLGSAIASHVAQQRPAQKLFLETPFDKISSAIYTRLPFLLRPFPRKYHFGNVEPLEKGYQFPVHIFHGTKDEVVPLKCALNLKPLLKPSDSFTIIEGGKHKNLSEKPAFQKVLDQYLGKKL